MLCYEILITLAALTNNIYTLDHSEVLAITYENGEKEIITTTDESSVKNNVEIVVQTILSQLKRMNS